MFKYLFFDDQKLQIRDNLTRKAGAVSPVCVYKDGVSNTSYAGVWVFKTADGKTRMLYQGKRISDQAMCLYIAFSADGIHFEPENVSDRVSFDGRQAAHEIMSFGDSEIAYIIEDTHFSTPGRYKMLMTENHFDVPRIDDVLYTSDDLVHWTKQEGVFWGAGNEPITGAFYNAKKNCYTIMLRPMWGVRRVGYVETRDFKTFTPFQLCLQADSLDEPLAEMYGMPAFHYDDWYVGFAHIYSGFNYGHSAKYEGGTMKTQLAYALDGNHWMRSLRETFIDGEAFKDAFGASYKMVWPSAVETDENGDILIYASASELEHGPAFREVTGGAILILRVRKDDFIHLETADKTRESLLATRDNIWQGGEAHVNLACEKATLAVFESTGDNGLSPSFLLDGYSHEDCIPFTGESRDWVPAFKNGKTLNDLIGRTLSLEIKLTNGSVYSLSGECVPAMNTEAAIYRKAGKIPEIL